uniref:Uncharacterized protein n=1 Tax=Plectus sambesii TaxID=2011161 RepID=A0A914W885_9BILA
MLRLFSAFILLHGTALIHANWLGLMCPDGKNTFYANVYNWQFDYNEFPISNKYDSASNAIDPCVTLVSANNAKYRDIGLLNNGHFGTTVCKRRCERALSIETPVCGPRRMSPFWQTEKYDSSALVSKINCSDWNLPMNDTEYTEPIHLQYSPTALTETDETYYFLQTIIIDKVTFGLTPIDDPTNVNYVNNILLKYQEIGQHLNYIHLHGISEPFVLTGLEDTLMQMPDVRGLLLHNLNIPELKPFLSNMANLNYIDLTNIPLSSFPSWLADTPNLMYIKIESPSPDLLELSNLDALPSLEYFTLRVSMIDHLPDTILKQSVGLRYLDLTCNELTSLPEHIFDHFTQLQGLALGGNQITTLGLQIFANLAQLRVLDLKQPERGEDYYGEPVDGPTSFTEMEASSGRQCNSNLPSEGFENLQNAHLIKNKQLQRIELACNVGLKMPEDLFAGLEGSLRSLDLYGLGLTNLKGFHLERLCELRQMRVTKNDFGIEEEWINYQIAINLQKLHRVYITDANISQASGPLFVLSRVDETLQAFVTNDVQGQPFDSVTCESAIWGSLLRNRPWSMPDDGDVCLNRFLALKVQAKSWYDQKKNLAYAPCFATIRSAAHQYGAMSALAIGALVLSTKLLLL